MENIKTLWFFTDLYCGAKAIFTTEEKCKEFCTKAFQYTMEEDGWCNFDDQFYIEEVHVNPKTYQEFLEYED